jgi:hypothetical protein
MKGIEQPKTIKAYALIKQVGHVLAMASTTGNQTLGIGFFITHEEAELHRTIEILKNSTPQTHFHIFELEIPNVAKKDHEQ